jgi:hypothetical protein
MFILIAHGVEQCSVRFQHKEPDDGWITGGAQQCYEFRYVGTVVDGIRGGIALQNPAADSHRPEALMAT